MRITPRDFTLQTSDRLLLGGAAQVDPLPLSLFCRDLMSKKPTRAPKGLKGGTLKKDDGEKIKWTGHLDTEATPSISTSS